MNPTDPKDMSKPNGTQDDARDKSAATWRIRPVTAADVKELQAISRETFRVTFDPFTRQEDMARFLRDGYATEKLLREIANPDSRFFFLVASGRGTDGTERPEVAGYLKVNVGAAQTESVKPNALEVERIYLCRSFQHRGIGRALIAYAEQIARQEKRDWMWLGVYEHNLVAQRFYARDGFVRVGQHVFQVGDDPQTDFLLAKPLTY